MKTFTLAMDCSTARGSVALVEAGPGRVAWRGEFIAGRGHGGELFTAIQQALGALAAADGALREIVVGLGPGSYSGVRQVVAAAVGLGAATGAALYGVPSVAALDPEEGQAAEQAGFHAVGDARRGTFYYAAVEGGACIAGPELLPDAAALHERLAARPRPWSVLAMECPLERLPPGAVAAWPLAERLLRTPAAARTLPPLEPIYLRGVSVTMPKKKDEGRGQKAEG